MVVPRVKIEKNLEKIKSLNGDIEDAQFVIESARNAVKCMKESISVLEGYIAERENDILESVATVETSKDTIKELAIEIEEIKRRWKIE